LFSASGVATPFSSEGIISAELEIKYAGYFERERAQADRIRQMGDFAIPPGLPYPKMNSLSNEARQKLEAIQPRTLAQASRIPGVSPSDIQNLVIEVGRKRTAAAS
jgi:tRNA uridine 5-carboxymethylaminomethyl modification enzyme